MNEDQSYLDREQLCGWLWSRTQLMHLNSPPVLQVWSGGRAAQNEHCFGDMVCKLQKRVTKGHKTVNSQYTHKCNAHKRSGFLPFHFVRFARAGAEHFLLERNPSMKELETQTNLLFQYAILQDFGCDSQVSIVPIWPNKGR